MDYLRRQFLTLAVAGAPAAAILGQPPQGASLPPGRTFDSIEVLPTVNLSTVGRMAVLRAHKGDKHLDVPMVWSLRDEEEHSPHELFLSLFRNGLALVNDLASDESTAWKENA